MHVNMCVWLGVHAHMYVQVSEVCEHMCIRVWRGVHSYTYIQMSEALFICVYMCTDECAFTYVCSGELNVHACVYMCLETQSCCQELV